MPTASLMRRHSASVLGRPCFATAALSSAISVVVQLAPMLAPASPTSGLGQRRHRGARMIMPEHYAKHVKVTGSPAALHGGRAAGKAALRRFTAFLYMSSAAIT